MRKFRILFIFLGVGSFILACQPTRVSLTPTPTKPLIPTNPPTSTILPTPTNTPSPTSTPPKPTPTVGITLPFLDDFSINQYSWPIGFTPGKYADTTYEIASGTYKWIVLSHKNAFSLAWPDFPPISSFTLTVDARQTSGKLENSDYGVIYRSMDGQKYFSFALNNNKYSVYLYDKSKGWQELVRETPSKAILPGKVNNLKIISANGSFTFFVNGTQLTRFSDSRILEGQPGLGVDMFNNGETAVFEFDNFSVTNP